MRRRAARAVWIGLVLTASGASLGARTGQERMDLGTFSVSLAVEDLRASRAFYEKLGFRAIDGAEEQNWLVLENGEAKIGLFQGMFEDDILTFNPSDVRGIQKRLKAAGIAFEKEAEEDGTGPTHAVLRDPDGNIILLDQF